MSKSRRPRPEGLALRQTGLAFSGPLPPPNVLERDDQVLPGAADRIVVMAEAQAEHRRRLEHAVIHGNLISQNRGQWMAFTLALLVIGVGAFMLWNDKPLVGLGAILLSLSAVLAVFITAKRMAAKERQEKRQDLESVGLPS